MGDEAAATPAPTPVAGGAPNTPEKPTTPPVPPADEPQEWEFVADGKPVKAKLSKAEIARHLSASHGLARKMGDFGREQAAFREKVARIQRGDLSALDELGLDPRKLLEERVLREAEEAQLSPEEKRQRELDKRQKELDEREAGWKRQQDQQQHARAVEATHAMLAKEVPAALQAVEMPDSEAGREALLNELEALAHELEATGQQLRPEHIQAAAKAAKASLSGSVAATLTRLPPEQAYDLLGEEWVRKLLGVAMARYEAKRGTSAPAPQSPPVPAERTRNASNGKHFITEAELYAHR